MIYQTIEGEPVPALGFGTWQITGKACREAVAHALALGYRHVDTAQAYDNEEDVGAGLRDAGVPRDEIFLTTKLWVEDLGPREMRRATEESLQRLRVDYVDLLLIHWPTENMRMEETLGAMRTLQEEGRTRHVGVSNFTPTLLRQAMEHARIFCNQVEYHPFLGQDRLREMARGHDLLLTAYSPLARGRVLEDETLRDIAGTHGKTPAQVTLRWLLQQEKVAAIPKATSRKHREANFDVFDFELSEDEMDRIFDLARDERLIDPAWAPAWER